MRVLLLYQYLNHTETVLSLSEHMHTHGIEIDCLNIGTLRYVNGGKGKSAFIRKIYAFWMKYGKLRRILSTRLMSWFILNQVDDYDIVDIHSYDLFYNRIIPEIKHKGKPLVIMIWGSDFYRASEQALEEKRLGFEYADIIHLETESVRSDFLKVYPEFENKIRIVQFGLDQLDRLKASLSVPIKNTSIIPASVYQNRTIITCGYNGMPGQRHEIMINAITSFSESLLNRIHVVVPFTYGGTESYKQKVKQLLQDSGLSYTFLDRNLSNKQITELRRISHVVVNIQVTDSFSASLQEHLMAGSVLIVGDWLPYQVFDLAGLYSVKTSLEDLHSNLEQVLLNLPEYRERGKENSIIAYRLSSWRSVANKWAEMYKECIN